MLHEKGGRLCINGQFGVVPEFDGLLAFAWGFIRPKLDQDAKSYRKKVTKNTYSSYCAKEKKIGNTPLDFEEWCAQGCIDTTEWTQTVSTDTERYPNTTPIAESSSKANTMTATKASADGGGKGEEEHPAEDEEAMRRRRIAMLASYC